MILSAVVSCQEFLVFPWNFALPKSIPGLDFWAVLRDTNTTEWDKHYKILFLACLPFNGERCDQVMIGYLDGFIVEFGNLLLIRMILFTVIMTLSFKEFESREG